MSVVILAVDIVDTPDTRPHIVGRQNNVKMTTDIVWPGTSPFSHHMRIRRVRVGVRPPICLWPNVAAKL